jgi:hypothetical protein
MHLQRNNQDYAKTNFFGNLSLALLYFRRLNTHNYIFLIFASYINGLQRSENTGKEYYKPLKRYTKIIFTECGIFQAKKIIIYFHCIVRMYKKCNIFTAINYISHLRSECHETEGIHFITIIYKGL